RRRAIQPTDEIGWSESVDLFGVATLPLGRKKCPSLTKCCATEEVRSTLQDAVTVGRQAVGMGPHLVEGGSANNLCPARFGHRDVEACRELAHGVLQVD